MVWVSAFFFFFCAFALDMCIVFCGSCDPGFGALLGFRVWFLV